MTDKALKPLPGVHDPWRTGHADLESADAPAGTVGSAHPMDEDLRPDIVFTFHIRGAAGALNIRGARSTEGAATVFLHIVDARPDLLKRLEEVGFRWQDANPDGFYLKTPDGKLHLSHPMCNIKQGFSLIVRTLISSARYDKNFQEQLKRFGIEPLLL